MTISRTELIEHLSQMSVMEVATLVQDLEETWGVSATPQPPENWQNQFDQREVPQEQTEFDVVLVSFGEKKIPVIKALRLAIDGLGLKETKDLVESAPVVVKESVSREEADLIAVKLREAGATATVK